MRSYLCNDKYVYLVILEFNGVLYLANIELNLRNNSLLTQGFITGSRITIH